MTPRSRKPVLLISGTNISKLPKLEKQDCTMMDSLEEFPETESNVSESNDSALKTKGTEQQQENFQSDENSDSLTDPFREYLNSRSIIVDSLADSSFSSQTDDYSSTTDIKNLDENKISTSLLHCLNGYAPLESSKSDIDFGNGSLGESTEEEKELVLRPKQFDENGKAIVYETSF